MDLKELRYFRAIVECGTLTKASAYLRVAQPALSRQIRKLEHDLGVELLRRTSRGVTPTPAGVALLQRTVNLEHELDVARREVSGFAKRVTGNLHLAVQYPVSTLVMPEIVKAYSRQYPDVALHVVDGVSRSITDGLLSEAIDMAIVDTPSHEHVDLTVFPLWVESLRLVGPRSATFSPLFKRGTATIADVAELSIIIPSKNHAVRRLTEAAFARNHLPFRPAIEADGALMICEMIKAGLGYTLMPPCTYYQMLQQGDLAAIEVRPTIRRVISLVMRTVLLADNMAAPLIELIKQAAPRLAATEQFGPAMLWHDEDTPPVGPLKTILHEHRIPVSQRL